MARKNAKAKKESLQYFQNAAYPIASQDDTYENEKNTYFSGDLSKLEDWIKHENFDLDRIDREKDRTLKDTHASKAYKFSIAWAIFIALVVTAKATCNHFNLDTTEYVATIGTLTITILTYYMVVIKSIFPNGKN